MGRLPKVRGHSSMFSVSRGQREDKARGRGTSGGSLGMKTMSPMGGLVLWLLTYVTMTGGEPWGSMITGGCLKGSGPFGSYHTPGGCPYAEPSPCLNLLAHRWK